MFIPLASPDIQQQDIEEVICVLKSGMLIQGKEVETFETKVSQYKNCGHSIAVKDHG